MRVLVLGGDGFLGSHFVDSAVKLEHDVTVFDRFLYGQPVNLNQHKGKINLVSGDFNNSTDLSWVLKNQDIVYHFISVSNPYESWDDPFVEIDIYLRSTLRLFQLSALNGVKKIVFPSSGGTVYGPQERTAIETTLPNPESPHGIVKLTIEKFLNYFRLHDGINADIYRIANPFGPRQPFNRPQGVIGVWLKKILQGSEIVAYGDHETLRDYVFVKDAAFLMTNSLDKIESSDIYNLGTGVGTSIIQLLNILRKTVDVNFRWRVKPRRTSDVASIVLDSTKLLADFPGFTFQKLEDRMPDTFNYYKDLHTFPNSV